MYVITGATSRTGSIVAHQLLDQGQPVRVIGRSLVRLVPFTDRGAEAAVADPTDAEALTAAFQGARAAWLMVQPNYIADSADFPGYQAQVVQALTTAITQSQLSYAVTLSSWGADQATGTGPVLGLHHLEQALNQLPALHVLHLRADYFMENTLAYVPTVVATGRVTGPFAPELLFPLVATDDIGHAAATALAALAFRGKSVLELQGQRDLTLQQATALIGQAIGQPALAYAQITLAEFAEELRAAGVSANVRQLMDEVVRSINSGHIRTQQPRTSATTTATSFEAFVESTWVPAYRLALTGNPLS